MSDERKKELDVPKILLYGLEFIVLIVAIFYIYESIKSNESTGIYSEHAQKETIRALITALNLQNVHEILYVGLTPKIQIYIEEDMHFVNSYYIEITRGDVIITDGETMEKDIIIRTSQEEISKMIEDNNYAKESVSSKKTTIEKVANEFILSSKGYPDFSEFGID